MYKVPGVMESGQMFWDTSLGTLLLCATVSTSIIYLLSHSNFCRGKGRGGAHRRSGITKFDKRTPSTIECVHGGHVGGLK